MAEHDITMPATATSAVATASSAVADAVGFSAAYLRSCRHSYDGAGVLLLRTPPPDGVSAVVVGTAASGPSIGWTVLTRWSSLATVVFVSWL